MVCRDCGVILTEENWPIYLREAKDKGRRNNYLCINCKRKHDREYAESHKVECRTRANNWYHIHKTEVRGKRKEYEKWYREQTKEKRREEDEAIKIMALSYYGNRRLECVCCGETKLDFLTIDHINDNGAEERKRLNRRGGIWFYKWLIENNYPSGYQTYCWNCQWGKRLNGTCPHQKAR